MLLGTPRSKGNAGGGCWGPTDPARVLPDGQYLFVLVAGRMCSLSRFPWAIFPLEYFNPYMLAGLPLPQISVPQEQFNQSGMGSVGVGSFGPHRGICGPHLSFHRNPPGDWGSPADSHRPRPRLRTRLPRRPLRRLSPGQCLAGTPAVSNFCH